MKHTEELLFTLPDKAPLTTLDGAGQNRSAVAALGYHNEGSKRPDPWLIWNGKKIKDFEYCHFDLPQYDLNPSGTHLAVATARHRAGNAEIRIYDDSGCIQTYIAGMDVVYQFGWMSDTELAWTGWDKQLDSRKVETRKAFINGKPAPEKFRMTRTFGGGKIFQFEHHTFTIDRNGKRSPNKALGKDADPDFPEFNVGVTERPFISNTSGNAGQTLQQIYYKDYKSPKIDAEINRGIETDFIVDRSETEIAYVETFMGPTSRVANRWLGRYLNAMDQGGCLSIFAWPVALLFNPYFGIGTFLMKMSERSRVAVWNLASNTFHYWPRCHFIHRMLRTNRDQLVSVEGTRLGMRVVVEGVAGPVYSRVYNLTYDESGNISYLATKNTCVYRVAL